MGDISNVHHVGATVRDLDTAIGFWEALLERPPRFRGLLARPYLGESVGIEGVAIDVAFFELPGGVALELLDYRVEGREQLPDETKHPGNVHLCLEVADADAVYAQAVALGARPLRAAGPVDVDAGPNRGARVGYLRVHDGISVEVYQPAGGVTGTTG